MDSHVDLSLPPSDSEIEEAKSKIDSNPFIVDALINNLFITRALFDTGCLPYSAFSESFVKRHNLPRIKVEPRELKLAKDDDFTHNITNVTLDINGRRERLWGYIIKNLHYDVILGKGWAENNNVVYKAGKRQLRIGNGPTRVSVRESGWMDSPHVRERTGHIRDGALVSARPLQHARSATRPRSPLPRCPWRISTRPLTNSPRQRCPCPSLRLQTTFPLSSARSRMPSWTRRAIASRPTVRGLT